MDPISLHGHVSDAANLLLLGSLILHLGNINKNEYQQKARTKTGINSFVLDQKLGKILELQWWKAHIVRSIKLDASLDQVLDLSLLRALFIIAIST